MKQKIIAVAREWLGTAFCHQGRIKKSSNGYGACDCLGLVIEVSKSLNLKTKYGLPFYLLDRKDYSSIPDGKDLQSELDQNLEIVDMPEEGDLVLLSFLGQPQHLAFIGGLSRKYDEVIAKNIATKQSLSGYSLQTKNETNSLVASKYVQRSDLFQGVSAITNNEDVVKCDNSQNYMRSLGSTFDDEATEVLLQQNKVIERSVVVEKKCHYDVSRHCQEHSDKTISARVSFYDVRGSGFTLIHAYMPLGKVCEHIFDQKWQRRVVAYYRFSF